jgi:hypothetical protein
VTSTRTAIDDEISALLAEPPGFGAERWPSAAQDHARLMPVFQGSVDSARRSADDSLDHNRSYREAVLRVVSIDFAAGAPAPRCRRWFRCLASLAAWTPAGATQPASLTDAAIWTALAGDYDVRAWPDGRASLDEGVFSDEVVYRLLARQPLPISDSRLFDHPRWRELCVALEATHADEAARCFASIADYWLAEYAASDTTDYDPELACTFEPAPNAALAIALGRDRMPIRFARAEHDRFYRLAQLMTR